MADTTTDPNSGFGFNKAGRNAAQDAAAAAAAAAPPLEPSFPFVVQSFDPNFFGIPAALIALAAKAQRSS